MYVLFQRTWNETFLFFSSWNRQIEPYASVAWVHMNLHVFANKIYLTEKCHLPVVRTRLLLSLKTKIGRLLYSMPLDVPKNAGFDLVEFGNHENFPSHVDSTLQTPLTLCSPRLQWLHCTMLVQLPSDIPNSSGAAWTRQSSYEVFPHPELSETSLDITA